MDCIAVNVWQTWSMNMVKKARATTKSRLKSEVLGPTVTVPVSRMEVENAPVTKAPRSKILIVDDHPMVRERLGELINQEADLATCGEADDAFTAMAAIATAKPDLAIVDISLKDTYGIELIKDIKKQYPKLPVLVVSMHDESLYAERALRAGARGYVTKQEASRKVVLAIRQILAGDIYVSEKLAAVLVRRVAGGRSDNGGSPADLLTDRELEIFQLLGGGHVVREIAKRLHVSVKTVEAHRANIKQKLNFKTSAELLHYAIQFVLQEK
jgi:DNA-binding NarL/FixJ family response regulator